MAVDLSAIMREGIDGQISKECIRMTTIAPPRDEEADAETAQAIQAAATAAAVTVSAEIISRITLLDEDEENEHDGLTANYIATVIAPYLQAVTDLQHLLDELQGREYSDVRISSISKHSPVSIDLLGAISAIKFIQETIRHYPGSSTLSAAIC
jgi:hypothetical protein